MSLGPQVSVPMNATQYAVLTRVAADRGVTRTHMARIAIMEKLGLPVNEQQTYGALGPRHAPVLDASQDPLARKLEQKAADSGMPLAVVCAQAVQAANENQARDKDRAEKWKLKAQEVSLDLLRANMENKQLKEMLAQRGYYSTAASAAPADGSGLSGAELMAATALLDDVDTLLDKPAADGWEG